MEDGYRLIDYGVNLNDVIQLMVRAAPLPTIEQSENDEALSEESNKIDEEVVDTKDKKSKQNVDGSLIYTTCPFYEVNLFKLCCN